MRQGTPPGAMANPTAQEYQHPAFHLNSRRVGPRKSKEGVDTFKTGSPWWDSLTANERLPGRTLPFQGWGKESRYRRGGAGRSPRAGSVSSATSATKIMGPDGFVPPHPDGYGPTTQIAVLSAASCQSLRVRGCGPAARTRLYPMQVPRTRTRSPTRPLPATKSWIETRGKESAFPGSCLTGRAGRLSASEMAVSLVEGSGARRSTESLGSSVISP